MFQALHFQRLSLLCALLFLGMAGLESRLVWLQLVQHDELQRKAAAFTHMRRVLPPWRGEIRDRAGMVLATSQPLVTVCANLSVCTNRPREVARVAASLLGTRETELTQALLAVGEPSQAKAVVLRRHVGIEQWEFMSNALAEASFGFTRRFLTRSELHLLLRLQRTALFTEEEQIRIYPYAASMAHLTGYVSASSNPPWPTGVAGVEGALDGLLMGKPGLCVSERDAGGRELAFRRTQYVPVVNGNHLMLTIDLNIQQIADRALAHAVSSHFPKSASVLVVRPRTGEILAWAAWPGLGVDGASGQVTGDWRNHALSDKCEPGSTFKMITLAAALNERQVTLDAVIFCGNGRFRTNRVTVHDHAPYGRLTVREAIAKSSNVAFAKIALKLGPERLRRYILDFGFGRTTGIPLIAETAGYVPPLARLADWATLVRVGFGQSLAVSQLQMTMAVCAICNDGRLMRPLLVSQVVGPDGQIVQRVQPRLISAVISPLTARQVRQALQEVLAPGGTGAQARLVSYTAGGKTGTAQKSDADGYLADRYYASFIGFFPVEEPEICISVVLDEPHNGYYGGIVCAPVFRAVAEQVGAYLGIPSDKPSLAALNPEAAADAASGTDAFDLDSDSVLARVSRP